MFTSEICATARSFFISVPTLFYKDFLSAHWTDLKTNICLNTLLKRQNKDSPKAIWRTNQNLANLLYRSW